MRLANCCFQLRIHRVDQLSHVKLIFLRHQRLAMQHFPIFFRHAMKRFHNFGIELPPGPIVQLLRRCFIRLATTIYAIARNGVESISNRENTRADVDLFAA